MPKPESFPIEKIFVSAAKKKTIKSEIVGEIDITVTAHLTGPYI
jgi:hypothetical protein